MAVADDTSVLNRLSSSPLQHSRTTVRVCHVYRLWNNYCLYIHNNIMRRREKVGINRMQVCVQPHQLGWRRDTARICCWAPCCGPRDGHGLGPSMGWVELGRVAFSGTCDGLIWVGLNEKYCGIVAEYCKTHTFHCPQFSHLCLKLFITLKFCFFCFLHSTLVLQI